MDMFLFDFPSTKWSRSLLCDAGLLSRQILEIPQPFSPDYPAGLAHIMETFSTIHFSFHGSALSIRNGLVRKYPISSKGLRFTVSVLRKRSFVLLKKTSHAWVQDACKGCTKHGGRGMISKWSNALHEKAVDVKQLWLPRSSSCIKPISSSWPGAVEANLWAEVPLPSSTQPSASCTVLLAWSDALLFPSPHLQLCCLSTPQCSVCYAHKLSVPPSLMLTIPDLGRIF